MNYFLTPAYTLPENTPFKRVGIIPYFREYVSNGSPNTVSPDIGTFDQKDPNGSPNGSPNGALHFFLMLDSKYQELTDCGGLPKQGETWLETAIRETEEESRNKFRFSQEYILNEGLVAWREDHRIAIIFINVSSKIPNKMHAAKTCYNYRVDYLNGIYSKDKRHRLENSDMFFYDVKETENLAKQDSKIFKPVRMLLLKIIRCKMLGHLL